ncbi:nucleolar RNA-binding Nop10p family protein [Candidatus Woesearchaeota archaeon]|nr:nucleolar RNA-binding Nop10p family protein [Candidatus Woesearchaeota archaeon]
MKCPACGKYTMKKCCCGKETFSPKPAKYSPEDSYGSYRRQVKKPMLKERGLL